MSMQRPTPIDLDPEEFRKLGHRLVDRISALLGNIRNMPVTHGESPREIQGILDQKSLPERGTDPGSLIDKSIELLFHHSLFNGHPKFFGYITSSPAPLGILADLLASAINPNVGAQILSPMATEIEKQTIRWLAEFIGYDQDCGGSLVSGGNVANITAFLAGVNARAGKNIRKQGMSQEGQMLTVYCSKTTHTWIEKAAMISGLGSEAVRWIPADDKNRMILGELEAAIRKDLDQGNKPVLVAGTAGDVSTGAVDDLEGIAAICEKYGLWFHVDGAYGVPAAVLPELKTVFQGIEKADSIAMDPHKWLYSPLEAGCTLVKDPQHLIDTYSSHPEYYNFDNWDDEVPHNFYEYGFQNSRGFRALKVWMVLQQMGRSGYETLIREDIRLAGLLYELAEAHPELQPMTHNLSITTFRYVPPGVSPTDEAAQEQLNSLNTALLNDLQIGGEAFVSNANIRGMAFLRSCIVNFRTSEKDIRELVDIIVRRGRLVREQMAG